MQNKEASPSGKRFAFFVAVACVPAALFAWIAGYGYQRAEARAEPSVPAVPTAAPAPELPCVQEECSERAKWFVCEHQSVGVCHKYRVDYEQACVCLKRDTP